MTESEFTVAVSSGAIQADTADEGASGGAAAPATTSISLEQFLPMLMQLQSVQLCVSAAPTYIPQTFQDQIVFVFDGTNYYLYLYFNNQWNEFAVSGGGGSGVDEILAGSGISVSGPTGNVTITNTGILSIIAGTGISISVSGGDVTITNDGITSVAAGSGISVSTSGGVATVSATGGGNSFATATGTISDITLGSFTTSPQDDDTVVTHGLGTTPKLIIVSINNFQVPGVASGGTGTQLKATLYITFDASGTNVSGFSTYFFTGGTLQNGGNIVNWSSIGANSTGTMILELISIGATTFTFRIVYSATNAGSYPGLQGFVQGISWLALG